MAISVSTGLVSGIDYDSMVTQLMQVESQPLTRLQTKEASYQAKLTAYGTLKGALSSFQSTMAGLSSASQYRTLSATHSKTEVATVSAASSAKTGTYSLEVSQLAQAQKLVAAGKSSTTDAIGSGTLTFDFGTISGGTLADGVYTDADFTSSGSGVKTVTIDSSNNSLAGIRDAINAANIGVTATIINDGGDAPYRLALSVTDSGEANSLKISVDGDPDLTDLLSYDVDNTQKLTQTVASQNATFKVDGIAITKSSNTVTDVISGVTMNLLSTNEDNPSTITLTRDTESITKMVNSFVEAYNTVIAAVGDVMSYDAETEAAGILNGESTVRSIQTQLRKVLTSALTGNGSVSTLGQIGVALQKDGTLAVDATKLSTALNNNFESFAGLFAAAGTSSDSLVSYAGSSSKTQAGAYAVTVTQLATQASLVGSALAEKTVVDSSNKNLTVQLNGKTATITLTENAEGYTAAELATEIQSKINSVSAFSTAGSAVTVSGADGKLTLTSTLYGSASTLAITGGTAFGLTASATATGKDVAGTINGVAAVGVGQTLTGAASDASAGLRLTITGGTTGSRGSVNFSQGYAYQFNSLLTSMLNQEGVLQTRTDGLTSTIEQLQDDQKNMSARLKIVEARYRTQFSNLEVLLSSMNTTSTYLLQQIEALEALRKQS